MTIDIETLDAGLGSDYALVREVGQGGMAVVFLARDLKHGRDVAIKILRPEIATGIGFERFQQEIQIAANLRHAHILPLFDSGSVNELPYYVTPFVEDESLRERLRREGPLPIDEAIRIARDVGDALAYLQSHGLVHRDIKPGNILLETDHALVADFGIAHALTQAGGDRLTTTGVIVGTPAYMSPEQCAGEGTVDARSDIYSLACVLYEMLAGEAPFTGPNPQVVQARHLHADPPSLRVVRPTVPPALQEVIERGLAKQPADRYSTATEFVDAAAEGAKAPPEPTVRRWRGAVLSIAAVVVLGLVALWQLSDRQRTLDRNRLVVFPLVSSSDDRTNGEDGQRVALMIGSALENTDPLRWLYGWTWLSPEVRDDPRRLSPDMARDISRAQEARYYLSGSILQSADSTTVILELNDVEAQELRARASASGGRATPVTQLGLVAIGKLLPEIIEGDVPGDPGALADRDPAAIANWLQAEREYRSSRFEEALRLFTRAVDIDSSLAPAALHGARAATWMDRLDLARKFMRLAKTGTDRLSRSNAAFLAALDRYLAGRADSTVLHLREALAHDPRNVDAWSLLGEVQIHLLPNVGLDSLALREIPPPIVWDHEALAEEAFTTARRYRPDFTPPLVHLAEIALRRGQLEAAERLIEEFREAGPDPARLHRLTASLGCISDGRGVLAVGGEIALDANGFLALAAPLAASRHPAGRECAKTGFASALAMDTVPPSVGFAALLGLQNMLVAEGRQETAIAVLDSAVASGSAGAVGLYVVNEVAGVPTGGRAERFVAQLSGDYAGRFSSTLWLLGSWEAHLGNEARLAEIARVLAERTRTGGDRLDSLVHGAMAAQLALMERSDPDASAPELLEPTGSVSELAWSLWEPLAGERLALARRLLQLGEFATAHRVASVFDHPAPIVFQLYLPASLALRAEAADSLGRPNIAEAHRRRLSELMRAGPIGSGGV